MAKSKGFERFRQELKAEEVNGIQFTASRSYTTYPSLCLLYRVQNVEGR